MLNKKKIYEIMTPHLCFLSNISVTLIIIQIPNIVFLECLITLRRSLGTAGGRGLWWAWRGGPSEASQSPSTQEAQLCY